MWTVDRIHASITWETSQLSIKSLPQSKQVMST